VGFFKDLKQLSDQSKAIGDAQPPMKERMADVSARMAGANQMMANMAQSSAAATWAMTNGVATTATVTGARQTGAQLNFSPVVELDLLVMMPSGVPMPVTRQEAVMQIHLGRCQPGSRLKVYVDPANPGNLCVDWNTPVF
jgi:hypothetical protein